MQLSGSQSSLPAVPGTQVQSLSGENPLAEGMTSHSSVLAWRIPWTEEPGGLQSIQSQRVGHDWSDLAPAPNQLPDSSLSYPMCSSGNRMIQLSCWTKATKSLHWISRKVRLDFPITFYRKTQTNFLANSVVIPPQSIIRCRSSWEGVTLGKVAVWVSSLKGAVSWRLCA